ncbi:MAG: cell division protein FtsQ [Parasphingorhabdus sp.]|jgi:cell division protein FtsQ
MNARDNAHSYHYRGWSRWSLLMASAALLISVALLAADRLFLPDRFQIQEIEIVTDGTNVDQEKVKQAVSQQGKRSWFSINLDAVEEEVIKVPWVYSVQVRRKWPARLVVTVEEARPAARWNKKHWLNQRGELLVMPADYVESSLPVLSGPDREQIRVVEMYRALQQLLVVPHWQINNLEFNRRTSWQLTLQVQHEEVNAKVDISLGKDKVLERFRRFSQAFADRSLETLARMERVDLRYSNGMAVRWRAIKSDSNQVVDDSKAMTIVSRRKS